MTLERKKALARTPLNRPRKGFWTCQRKQDGIKCGSTNPNRNQKCKTCGKRRRPKSKPKHMMVLQSMSYEEFVELSGGETCGICGGVGKTRRLHRDHCHDSGRARELLCFPCNVALPKRVDAEWLEAAATYMRRVEERWRMEDGAA